MDLKLVSECRVKHWMNVEMPSYLHLHMLPQVGIIILLLFSLTHVLHLTKLQVQLAGLHLEGPAGALFGSHSSIFGLVTLLCRGAEKAPFGDNRGEHPFTEHRKDHPSHQEAAVGVHETGARLGDKYYRNRRMPARARSQGQRLGTRGTSSSEEAHPGSQGNLNANKGNSG